MKREPCTNCLTNKLSLNNNKPAARGKSSDVDRSPVNVVYPKPIRSRKHC